MQPELSRNRPRPAFQPNYDFEQDKWQRGIKIPVYGDNIDNALKKLKRSMLKDGIYEAMRRHEHFTKPSEQKRADKAAGIKKWRQKEQKLIDDMVLPPRNAKGHGKGRKGRRK